MHKIYMFLVILAVSGCAPSPLPTYHQRSDLVRDVEGYAIASCFLHQSDEPFKSQGDAWASSIVQLSSGDDEEFVSVAERVKTAMDTSPMAVVRIEENATATTMTVPLMYCNEIIDNPSVREAIQTSIRAMWTSYGS